MASDQPKPPSPPAGGGGRRRSSFAELFGTRSASSAQPGSAQPNRRLSITTLGLSTLPANQASPFGNARNRAESISSANSGSVDESPFEDEPSALPTSSVPTSPFARRMSFGAKAMRDLRSGGQPNGSSANEGFDFAENLRARAERTSVSGPGIPPAGMQIAHQRAKSVATPEAPKPEMRKQRPVPDAFQERILKGDFYMD